MKRGIIFSGCELLPIEGSRGFRTGRWLSQEELNYLVLYWDKLVSPTNNLVHTGIQKEDELISCGILTRPRFIANGFFGGGDIADFHAATQTKTLNVLRSQDPDIDWRMHYFADQIAIIPEDAQRKATLRFELANLLPVPQAGIPIYEILEFKERRADELTALHAYLDELYFEVLNSGDFDLKRNIAISGLKRAIEDINKLNASGWQSPIRIDISSSFEFDLNQLVSGVTTISAALANDYPLATLSVGAALTFLGGFIKITPKVQNVIRSGDPKLAYLTKAKSEGLVRLN
ncbi:DUF6236 family protein [Cronobacter sakazakii]|nr:hypothetical protein FZI15_10245 [Cronobacter sakazakii]MDK1221237.1 DUF6236 family protein [Cronobacter turicensis]KAB0825441.1 hypothetical protein FZI44_03690 [Cronobacter sakazakii]MDI7512553.1 DUF6236 family protein [Cronobacter sakazakii]MDI7519919.1 DUF6236 family protein [Cronobacter sakazakii]